MNNMVVRVGPRCIDFVLVSLACMHGSTDLLRGLHRIEAHRIFFFYSNFVSISLQSGVSIIQYFVVLV